MGHAPQRNGRSSTYCGDTALLGSWQQGHQAHGQSKDEKHRKYGCPRLGPPVPPETKPRSMWKPLVHTLGVVLRQVGSPPLGMLAVDCGIE